MDPRRHSRRIRPVAVWTVAGLALWTAFLSFPLRTAGDHLDPSWMQALGYALKNRIQAGTELAFVYSPIGYFLTSVYDRDLIGPRIAWELLVGAVLAGVFAGAVSRTPGRAGKGVLLGLVVLFVPYQKDPLYVLGMVMLTALVLERGPRFDHVAAVMPLLAILSCAKFTYLMLACVCVLAVTGGLWRRHSRLQAISACTLFAACFCSVWVLFGQSPRNIPAFLVTSVEVARGYNEAMAKAGGASELVLGIVVLLLSVGGICRATLARPFRSNRLLIGVVVAAGLFMVWKHGFVRQDKGHVLVFFTFTMVAPLLVAGKTPRKAGGLRRRLRGLPVQAAVALSVTGFFMRVPPWEFAEVRTRQISDSVRAVASFDRLRVRLEEDRAKLQRIHDLPVIRGNIGTSTVDQVSYEQGVLLLNELTYHPRPLLQSCSAYTPGMLAMDARFFEGPRAPAFVIFKLQTIDRRLPTVDDCDALRVLMRDYVPVLVERGYLLFKREVGAGMKLRPAGEPIRQGIVPLGEPINLSSLQGDTHFLSLGIEYSFLGKVVSLLYKPAPVYLEVQADDDTHYRFRIPRSMVKTGFLVDPILRDQTEFLSWYLGRELKRPRSVRLALDRGTSWMFERDVQVRVESHVAALPQVCSAVSLAPVCFMFETPPYSAQATHPPDCWEVHGEKVCVIHAPGTVRLRAGEGLHRLSGRFGIVPGAYEEGRTDGVLFRAMVVRGDEERTLFQRFLDPLDRPADRGFQQLAVRFRTEDSVDVVLETDPGPRGDDGWDWSFWTDVEIYTHPDDG